MGSSERRTGPEDAPGLWEEEAALLRGGQKKQEEEKSNTSFRSFGTNHPQ